MDAITDPSNRIWYSVGKKRKARLSGSQTYREQLAKCHRMYEKLHLDRPFYHRAKTAPPFLDKPVRKSTQVPPSSAPLRLSQALLKERDAKTSKSKMYNGEDANSESTTSSAEFDRDTGNIRRRHRFAPKDLISHLKSNGFGDPRDNLLNADNEEPKENGTRCKGNTKSKKKVKKIAPYVQDEMRFKAKLDYVEVFSKIKLFCEFEKRRRNAYKFEATDEDREKYIEFVSFLNQTTRLNSTTAEELEAKLPDDLLARIDGWISDCESSFGLHGRVSLIEESVASAIVNRNVIRNVTVPKFEPIIKHNPSPPQKTRVGALK